MDDRSTITLAGTGASTGVAVGPVHLLDRRRIRTPRRQLAPGEIEAELLRLDAAIELSDEQLCEMKAEVEHGEGPEHAMILEAHRLMLRDPAFVDEAKRLVRAEQVNAEWAVRRCMRKLRGAFGRLGDEYFRERRHDVAYVSDRVVRNLMGQKPDVETDEIPPGVVLVAKDLSPADATVLLVPEKVLALVTDRGTRTSHTAIVARARGIPAVVGTDRATEAARAGDVAAVDGAAGEVVLRPGPERLVHFAERKARLERYEESLAEERALPPVTRDGKELRLFANIEFHEELDGVQRSGAGGVGLFRTEFLYVGSGRLPTEQAHFEAYRRVVEEVGGREVTIRVFDAGADKLPSDRLRRSEPNPALGLRALRLLRRQPEILDAQLRGILRASAHGRVRVLFPMITCVSELRDAKEALARCRDELAAEGVPMAARIPVGAMIEVPSAAQIADRLAREADFFSIGTNDLIQYAMAIDRQNREVAYLYRPLHLSILRMLRLVIDAAKEAGIHVAVCGEMAGDPRNTLVLLGMGVDELSMAPAAIPVVRRVVRASTTAEARELAERAMAWEGAEGIEAFVHREMEARFGHLIGVPGEPEPAAG
ncbi:MAG TPA: phosphoenolpyruvate--protein phosphotransferase [Vulgatibacter sp.]|nr:phosphoenolpyruvate--protein phosphotransferase [Vulgatibacter sp.]